MEYLLFMVIIFIAVCQCDGCDSNNSLKCNRALVEKENVIACYTKSGNTWTVTISCKNGYIRIGPDSYTCNKSPAEHWVPAPQSSCIKVEPCTEDICKKCEQLNIHNGFVYENKTNGIRRVSFECKTGYILSKDIVLTCLRNGTHARWNGSPPKCLATDDTEETATQGLTSQHSTDEKSSSLATAVSVPIVVIALIGIVVFVVLFIWRRRKQKLTSAEETYPGTSFTNKNYQDSHGLDRQVSLLNMNPNSSDVTGYSEISPEQLQAEDNVYQTIDDLPEDQIASNDGYGHLKTPVIKPADKSYSHLPASQTNGKPSEITYSHTGNTENKQNFKDEKDDDDYNRLQTGPTTNQEKQASERQDDRIDDDDSEYNHAKAGLREPETENKADTYSHVKSTSKTHPATADDASIKPESIEGMEGKKEPLHGVDRDGYETAVGTAHDYFILQPENEKERETEDAETQNHPYFIL